MAAVLFPKAEVVLSQPWTEIFHRNRNQYTYIGNYCSVVAEVRYGLLQGFVLEPLLFLIYIIDICKAVPKANVKKLYADDTNEFLFDKDGRKLNSEANVCVQELGTWFKTNKLTFWVNVLCFF